MYRETTHSPRAVRRLTLVLLGLVVISGCVFRRLALSNAQTLLRMRIDDAFELSSEQETFVDTHLTTWLNDIHRLDIPKLQSLLADAVTKTERSVSTSEISELYARWDDIYAGAIRRSAPAVGEFLSRLAQHQLTHFKEHLSERQSKKIERIAQGKMIFVQKRTKAVASRFSDWMGDLNETQKGTIEAFAANDFELSQKETVAQTRSHAHLLGLLQLNKDAQTIGKFVLQQQIAPHTALDAEHAHIKRKRRDAWIVLITQITNSANKEQRKTFRSEAQSLAQDLLLIGEPPNAK